MRSRSRSLFSTFAVAAIVRSFVACSHDVGPGDDCNDSWLADYTCPPGYYCNDRREWTCQPYGAEGNYPTPPDVRPGLDSGSPVHDRDAVTKDAFTDAADDASDD